jgi:hypothetical protein
VAPGDPSVLIIEDDERFSQIVLGFAREKTSRASSPCRAIRH